MLLAGAMTLPLAAADTANLSATLAPDGGRIVIQAQGMPAPAPVFFSANVEQAIQLSEAEIVNVSTVRIQVRQGRPTVFSLGLGGAGEVMEVTGRDLRDWAVRQERTGNEVRRYLDVRPTDAAEGHELEFTVRVRVAKPALPGTTAVPLLTIGEAVGFGSRLVVQAAEAVDFRVTASPGLIPVEASVAPHEPARFTTTTGGRLDVTLSRRGAGPAPVELTEAALAGRVDEAAKSVEFHLRAKLQVTQAGARLALLSGHAALSEKSAGDGWHVELVREKEQRVYQLVGDREGMWPVDLAFDATLREQEGEYTIGFALPAGTVVPIRLEGLREQTQFATEAKVVPVRAGEAWQGYVPADGTVALAWAPLRKATEGALFYTSAEQTEVRVGAGLLRQEAKLTFRVLQGKLPSVQLSLDGPGDILGVVGPNVVGWNVVAAPDGTGRRLEVRFSRPVEDNDEIVLRSQSVLGAFPVRAQPLRISPVGAVRHSGLLRIANNGAVRLEVADAKGLMQLAPTQFPGPGLGEEARQVFVYRFPSEKYGYTIAADRIQPEIGVSQVVTYELTDTDRVINAEVELDVREAPVRDWTLGIPEDYTVVAVTGRDVADHAPESEARDGYRALKVLFGNPVQGRELITLRLEKNQPAAAGEWKLPALNYPGAKTVRGHVGAVSAPGYRIVPVASEGLVDVPLSFFPRQTGGLQQAWRLRGPEWKATVRLDALGQSVQADVFHLYSLKEGVVYGSVLFNFFVVGAPASEWRIEVPEAVGNVDVVGQNVRRDWRREGNVLVVTLHQPVLGSATLLVTFEQPMSARGGTIHPGELRPLGVQGERGFIQVVSPLQVKHTINRAEGGLLKLEPLELPPEFRLLTSSPSLAVYQYTARPFTLEMGLEWYPRAETVEQVVDYAKLTSQVSREGQVVTTAQFYVKTRGRKALRMSLPNGAALWEARVDREVVTAGRDGDQMLLPLPARANPNDPVEVTLRIGQPAKGSGRDVVIAAPKLTVPVVINEWTVNRDIGRLLVPHAASAELTNQALTENGFEWLARHELTSTVMLLLATVLAALLVRGDSVWKLGGCLGACVLAVVVALSLALNVLAGSRPNAEVLNYAATMIPAGEEASIHVSNLSPGWALVSLWGWGAVVVGLGLAGVGWLKPSRWLAAGGVVLIGGGLLTQRPGAAYFYAAIAAAVGLLLAIPALARLVGLLRNKPATPPVAGGSGAAAASLLALVGVFGLGFGAGPELRAETKSPAVAGSVSPAHSFEAIVQKWTIREHRVYADVELTVRGATGDSLPFLSGEAVLTEFSGDGLKVGKIERDGDAIYQVHLLRDGLLTAHAKFELAVPNLREPIVIPTGLAVRQQVMVDLDQPGWAISSDAAVKIAPLAGLANGHSGATLILEPGAGLTIKVEPRQRDVASEATQFYAEVANLYVPGPGVVNGFVHVTVRPAQGRVAELDFDVPAGFTIGEVTGEHVGVWRFDPEKRRLHVVVGPPQATVFSFDLALQRGSGALPQELTLEPVRVAGAGDDVGMIALAFGDEAQPENVRAEGLSPVSADDFDANLVPQNQDKQPVALIDRVWRYGQAHGQVTLKVAPVAAEVRSAVRELLSFDDDRLVASVDLRVGISRVGLFSLSFELPAGLEIEALSGPALNNWTEAAEGGRRIITLHLNGQTLGEQRFNLSLAGAAPHAQTGWTVPKIRIREASRQTGELLLVPGKGLSLRAGERQNATPLDPRTVGGMQPGTLAFRLLQEDWSLAVDITALEPWITAQALEELTLREGQTLTRLAIRYRVENAALKQMKLRLPGLTDEQARTIRATGAAVSDFVRVAGEADTWAVHFQRGIAGETDVLIEYQGAAPAEQRMTLATPGFVDAKQTTLLVAVRSGGRLDLDVADLPRGWQRTDWTAVPAFLQSPSERSAPTLCFHVAEPERPLALLARQHGVAEALKLRVTGGEFTTVVSPEGSALTAINLAMVVTEKGPLYVRLPAGAQLFNALVNGESVTVVREGDTSLFHVAPNSEADRSATVRLVYAMKGAAHGGRVALTAPSFRVPLEQVVWHVMLPPGYALEDYRGSLQLKESHVAGEFAIEQYRDLVSGTRKREARKATALLEEANSLVQSGDQERAGEAFSKVARSNALDEASNEDARVQWRELRTQQALVGLSTRRQRLYLDNRSENVRNEQLEQAANLNPFMQGKTKFSPQQFEQLIMGNTVEENTALRGIAGRIVEQQLAAEPAPSAIDVTLAERGRVATFARTLQVDGSAPLGLELTLERTNGFGVGAAIVVLGGFGAVVVLGMSKRRRLKP